MSSFEDQIRAEMDVLNLQVDTIQKDVDKIKESIKSLKENYGLMSDYLDLNQSLLESMAEMIRLIVGNKVGNGVFNAMIKNAADGIEDETGVLKHANITQLGKNTFILYKMLVHIHGEDIVKNSSENALRILKEDMNNPFNKADLILMEEEASNQTEKEQET